MKSILRIFRFTSELRSSYILIGVLTIILAALAQVQPLITKFVIDELTKVATGGSADMVLVFVLAGLFFLTDVGQTLLSNIAGYWGDMTSVKIQRLMSQRYFTHLLQLPQSYFDTELSGKIINRMSRGITQISSYMQVMSNNFLQFIFSTIFTLAIVFYFSWQVGLMFLVIYPVFVYMTAKNSSKWQDYQQEINKHQDIASGRFAEAINQVKVVKSYLQEERERNVFAHHYGKMVETTKPQSRFWHSRDIGRRMVLNVIFLGIFGYIFVATAQGAFTIGTMVLLIQLAIQIRIPIFSISFIVDQTQRAISNTKDYFEVMDIKPSLHDEPHAKRLRIESAGVIFDKVSFGYDEQKVLKGVSFEVKPGSRAALVGESGEGKTTLTNLLMRLYGVDDGKILIDGQDISQVTQASLRRHISVVFQDPMLFSGTIRENIAYANPKATMKQIEAAAKAANAHDFIMKFDKGYDSEIGERGLKLSGGQKQRIAIARAILKDAPLLILDEATSSLDSRSEQMVQEALDRLMKNRTTIIIAHRLSTIQSVDTIITLKNGRVAEIGTPEELSSSGGIYDQLLRLQGSPEAARTKRLKQYDLAS